MKFETQQIHAGLSPDPQTGAVVTPIVTATTFFQENPEKKQDFIYSRVANPTRRALENNFKELEEARFAIATSSGCSAMSLILELLKEGSSILAEEDLYAGTLRLFQHLKETRNFKIHLTDFSDTDRVQAKIQKLAPQMIWIESPTNPALKILDIQKLAKMRGQALLVCDNTFASPYFQKPLKYGADIVFHSATKYISGHSDVMAGLIVGNQPELETKLRFLEKSLGFVLSPFDSYLLLRSLKTLSLRMDRHADNALKLAQFLEGHDKIDKVIYPGLSSHPQYELAKKQMSGFSGIISFHIQGSKQEALRFLNRLKLIQTAESLGAVESLAEHPLTMTHGSFSSEKVKENMIRLSVGLEHYTDLMRDIDEALK